MKLIPIVILILLHICFIEAVNVHSKADTKGSNDEDMMTSAGKESNNKAIGVKTQAQKKEMKHDVNSKQDMHTVTKRSTSNITVTDCYKTMTGFQRPNYLHIVGNEVFLTENGGSIHVFDVGTGLRLRKFGAGLGALIGVFVKGNRVLVTNHRETYSFSLNGDLFGVHYSYKPVGVAVDYNGLMYTTKLDTGKINVFNIDGTKSHVLSIGRSGNLRKIQFDKQGNLYVGNYRSKIIHVFDRHGSLIRSISVPTVITEGIHIDPYDDTIMYVADRKNGAGKVVKVKIATGEVIKTYSGLTGASDIAVAPDGKLWVVDFEGGSIRIYHEENRST